MPEAEPVGSAIELMFKGGESVLERVLVGVMFKGRRKSEWVLIGGDVCSCCEILDSVSSCLSAAFAALIIASGSPSGIR